MTLNNAPQCTATSKLSGVRCRNPAVTGYTVCRIHGAGNRDKPGGRPIVHGRYSRQLPARLAGRYVEALKDTKLLELHDEIALVDARLGDLMEQLNGGGDATDWREIMELVEQRRKLVESERKHMLAAQQMLSISQALSLFAVIHDVIRRYVTDQSTLAAISGELKQLTLIDTSR